MFYLAKTRTLSSIVQGRGDVREEVGFSHNLAPYWKWKLSEEREARQPFTNKMGKERKADM